MLHRQDNSEVEERQRGMSGPKDFRTFSETALTAGTEPPQYRGTNSTT
ncbi:hypothetical protein HanXRQr2_Chr05g0224841 [Helianthus annuus]|uniref:Uncharacterized protein n=1 Tax=Helianthus annuus TaxID=4232 RepID=A0A9K3J117_HELAN|nr:hypothetical protein HanXRQr2_Chr05g0224841 [Helianthus annuus]